MNRPIYLDNNATTQMDPEVFLAMRPFFMDYFGNPASLTHPYGWEAHDAVEESRAVIAKLLGSKIKKSIVYTSGATEANNLAILGVMRGCGQRGHFITQATEHSSVLECCEVLKNEGHEVTILDVDSCGRIDLDHLKKAFRENTILVSIMAANNEIGTLQPIREIASLCKDRQVLFHTDAAQAAGKILLDVEKDGIDLLSLSAHKMHGPKGVGALYVAAKSPPIPLAPLMYGGGHERGRRPGTLNVPGIVGLAKALEISIRKIPIDKFRMENLRDYFIHEILTRIGHSYLNGHPNQRLPNNINITLDYISAERVIAAIPDVAFSTGSACSSDSAQPSHVISALGVPKEKIQSAIRFALSRWTTREEIDYTIRRLVEVASILRKNSLEYEMASKT